MDNNHGVWRFPEGSGRQPLREAEDSEKWKGIVATSSMVSRLKDCDEIVTYVTFNKAYGHSKGE